MAEATLSQRTFSKILRIAEVSGTATVIRCRDSAGNDVSCNYFYVTVSPASGTAVTKPAPMIAFCPVNPNKALSTATLVTPNYNSSVSSLTASAPLGTCLLLTSGMSTAEYLCLPNEMFTQIQIKQFTLNPAGITSNNAFTITATYGIVTPFNETRSLDKNQYNKGS